MAVSGGYSELLAWAFHPGWSSLSLQRRGFRSSRASAFTAPWAPVERSKRGVKIGLRRGVCDLPGVPCVARQTLNHWITGEAV